MILFACGLSILAALAWGKPTNQELLANAAKALDFWQGFRSVGGWPWWTPNYLGGTSLAPAWGFMVVNVWLLLWTSLLGVSLGSLCALLLCLPIAAATSFVFIRDWTQSASAATIGALLYLASPSLWIRIAGVEHLVVVVALAVLPLAFLGVLRMVRAPTGWSGLFAGAGLALLALTYSKAAILALPFLVVFWACATVQHRTLRSQWSSPVRTGFMAGAFFLGVLPLLPSLREAGTFVFFEHGPFSGWQTTFSLKSAMQLLDRMGALSEGYAPAFAASTGIGGFYLGSMLVGALLFAWVFWKWNPVSHRLNGEDASRIPSGVFTVSAGAVLLGVWLAAGPRSVFFAHTLALETSATGMDWTVVPLWGMLLTCCWALWKITPGSGLPKQALGTAAVAVFLFVPGFRILEVLPFFNNIRAPFDFFQVPVPLFAATLGAVAVRYLWCRPWSIMARASLVALAVFLCLWDLGSARTLQSNNRLPTGTWQSFKKTQQFLKETTPAGAVLPVSGRYFYLLTPQESGRPLLMEAFQSYLQQRDFAWFLAHAQIREEFHDIGLRLAGASFVLWDFEGRRPADLPSLIAGRNAVFSDGDFSVYPISDPLYPAFMASSVIGVEAWDLQSYESSLIAARLRFVPIEGFPIEEDTPGFSGFLRGKELDLTEQADRNGGKNWQMFPGDAWKRETYQRLRLTIPSNAEGWVVLTQAWHPDWVAEVPGTEPIPAGRAFGALPVFPAVPGEEMLVRFQPPFWYDWAATATVMAWLALGGAWLTRATLNKSERKNSAG